MEMHGRTALNGAVDNGFMRVGDATLPAGNNIVRDAPDADLSGLNRNPADALRTETLRDVAVAVDAVKYIDIGLDREQNTDIFDGALKFVHDPVTFFKDLFKDEEQPAIPAARPAAAEGGE